jgi:leucyl aminopeptidase (aminopeptidase T)
VIKTLEAASISAMAVTSMRGELSARKTVLEIVTREGLRHAHMPSITQEVFVDGLAMDYRDVSAFMKKLLGNIEDSESLTMTSPGGTRLEFRYPSPPVVDELDGLIVPGRWQNLPSGQIIIYPDDAEGVFVADRSIGDWFEHKYDISANPVTFEFSKGQVRNISCADKRLERDLWLFIRSSDNSGRISELIIGSNLGLTRDHSNALYNGYRPGASISIGAFDYNEKVSWSSATVLPMMGKQSGIWLRDRRMMTDDVFSPELL